jgi:hypothetical protein
MLADLAAAALLAVVAQTAVLADLAAAALLASGEPAAVFADDGLAHCWFRFFLTRRVLSSISSLNLLGKLDFATVDVRC